MASTNFPYLKETVKTVLREDEIILLLWMVSLSQWLIFKVVLGWPPRVAAPWIGLSSFNPMRETAQSVPLYDKATELDACLSPLTTAARRAVYTPDCWWEWVSTSTEPTAERRWEPMLQFLHYVIKQRVSGDHWERKYCSPGKTSTSSK